MRKGQKPSRHYRRIHTCDGWKKILINPRIKKRKSFAGGIIFQKRLEQKGISLGITEAEKKRFRRLLERRPEHIQYLNKTQHRFDTDIASGEFNASKPQQIGINPYLYEKSYLEDFKEVLGDEITPEQVYAHEVGHAKHAKAVGRKKFIEITEKEEKIKDRNTFKRYGLLEEELSPKRAEKLHTLRPTEIYANE